MEIKEYSPTWLFNPSGTTLLILLAGLLLAGIIIGSGINTIALPLVIAAVLSGSLGYVVIPILHKLKTEQIIQEDGPSTHLNKAGTPTMGGIFFIPVGIITALIYSGIIGSAISKEMIAVSLVTIGYSLIGFLDDWQILRRKSNKGISPKTKLILQIGVAIAFCIWIVWTQPESITQISLPGKIEIPLGILFWPLATFVLAAETNATNLTDGVDGLAAGTGAIALLGLALIIAPNSPDLAIFAGCLSGSCLGFVLHNRHRAKVFMGDTGSLAIGGALAAVGLLSGNLWSLFILSGIFFVESISVIVQVSYYKATKGPDGVGKRLLKMAPFHHHLELSGWSETQIVGLFYLIGFTLLVIIDYGGLW